MVLADGKKEKKKETIIPLGLKAKSKSLESILSNTEEAISQFTLKETLSPRLIHSWEPV